MALVKRTYVDQTTVITADNLNDIQDEIIVNGLNIGKHSDSLADEYDSTAVYDVGDYCMHENVLYKCNTAITTIESWNASHWTAVTVGDELAQADWNEADNTKPDYIKNKPSIPVIDSTLTTQGQAADAKATGDKITEAEQIMSYLETGNTASRNYSAGEYVNWKGVLYTVNTGGISSGASFVAGSGGNLSAVGDGGGLNSLKNTIIRKNLNLDGLTASTISGFLQEFATTLNGLYTLSNLNRGDVLMGRVGWNSHDYFAFIATKTHSSEVQAQMYNRSNIYVAVINPTTISIVSAVSYTGTAIT